MFYSNATQAKNLDILTTAVVMGMLEGTYELFTWCNDGWGDYSYSDNLGEALADIVEMRARKDSLGERFMIQKNDEIILEGII
jgi:hypothetical protein